MDSPIDDDLPFLRELKWSPDGLIPAIVQDSGSGEVLMMAWMDEPAVRRTLATGQTHFYSRSRKSSWHKGATSGHVQHVESIAVDCDADVLLIRARQVGGACHAGYRSCFWRRVGPDGNLEVVASPVFEADRAYGPKGADPSGSEATRQPTLQCETEFPLMQGRDPSDGPRSARPSTQDKHR